VAGCGLGCWGCRGVLGVLGLEGQQLWRRGVQGMVGRCDAALGMGHGARGRLHLWCLGGPRSMSAAAGSYPQYLAALQPAVRPDTSNSTLQRPCPAAAGAGASAAAVCELLLKLYPLRQPLLSRHATDALTALASSHASHLGPKALSELLAALMQQEASFERKDLDLTLALTRFLEAALIRLAGLGGSGGWAAGGWRLESANAVIGKVVGMAVGHCAFSLLPVLLRLMLRRV
jgi:hypothetical protein